MTAGTGLVSDFDGTLARLDVDWAGLRRELGVARILDLWEPDGPGWERVTEEEVRAARTASAVAYGLDTALRYEAVAILTNNSERAVEVFLGRVPHLAERVVAVAGRETLAGPKNARDVFEEAMARLRAALAPRRVGAYLGDQDYELEYAASLVPTVIDARGTVAPRSTGAAP